MPPLPPPPIALKISLKNVKSLLLNAESNNEAQTGFKVRDARFNTQHVPCACNIEHYTNALNIKSILNSVYFMKYVDLWPGSVGVLSGAVSVCCSCLSVRCSLFQLLLHTARLFTFSTCVALRAPLVR